MIDLHSHILPGIDDGIQNIEDSIEVVEEAKKAGFNTIVATSHYSIPDGFIVDESKRVELINNLKEKVQDIDLILGNEIYVNGFIEELLNEKKASTINNSKYVLFELPLIEEYTELRNAILNITSKGYKLILAHPERYAFVQQDPRRIEEIIDMGVFLQANFLSILGFYGKQAQATVELLFKHNMISFLGTDIHRTKKYYPNIPKAKQAIISIIGEAEFDKISKENPKRVLENTEVDNIEYNQIKKCFFGSYK